MIMIHVLYSEDTFTYNNELFCIVGSALATGGLLMIFPFSLAQVGNYLYVTIKRNVLCQIYKEKKSVLDVEEEKIATNLTL